MIDFYYWSTPNGAKINIFLEETGLEYKLLPIDIGRGDQFDKNFLEVSHNNRIPAIVDHAPTDGGDAVSVFESGAILLYLAEKTSRFNGTSERNRLQVLQWLMWQMAGLGPMAGQAHHFNIYAPERIPYAMKRYTNECGRLYAVLNKQLRSHEYVADSYSIADMAIYPWINRHERQQQDLDDFPDLQSWYERIRQRPAVVKSYETMQSIKSDLKSSEASKILFEQSARTVR